MVLSTHHVVTCKGLAEGSGGEGTGFQDVLQRVPERVGRAQGANDVAEDTNSDCFWFIIN